MCVHSSVPPFFQLPLHASFHFQMQSRFSRCFAPCAISLVRLGSPRYCRSFSGMLICDVPVSITVLARGKCSQQSLTCPYKRNTSSVRVLAPISYDLLIRPCFLYVRLLREDVGRCTFASHCAPAFLPDSCHHRTLYHCWLRSTGEVLVLHISTVQMENILF